METYQIEIKEVRKCVVDVEADSREAAIAKLEVQYWKDPSKYILKSYNTFFH